MSPKVCRYTVGEKWSSEIFPGLSKFRGRGRGLSAIDGPVEREKTLLPARNRGSCHFLFTGHAYNKPGITNRPSWNLLVRWR